jgi:carbonic anhydrase/acetyltransferase-like protein (isoleucine patch superfamily)
LSAGVWIHPSAVVLGDVVLGDDVSIWPTAVLRGDSDRITIGAGTNIQDGAVVHVDPGVPCVIGARVTVGHRAIVHGATVEDGCLIGMGAIILNGAVIGRGSLVGAGAVVREGMLVPPGSFVLGLPAKVVRPLSDAEQARTLESAATYVARAAAHRRGDFLPYDSSQRESRS